jgi:hypothetical protein
MPISVCMIPAVLALLVHGWSLGEPFLAEDYGFLEALHSRSASEGSFLALFRSGDETKWVAFFRPVIVLSMAFDNWLWGIEPAGYHASNLLMFSLVCALTAMFAWRLIADAFVAGLAGVLLVLSPVVPEDVVWVTGRDGLIPLAAVLAAAIAVTTTRRPRFLWLGPGLFLIGLFSKEWVVAATPLLVAVRIGVLQRGQDNSQFVSIRSKLWEGIRSTAFLWPALLVYLALRTVAIGGIVGGYNSGGIGTLVYRGLWMDRWDYCLGLLLQVPESVLAGPPRLMVAALALVLMSWGVRRARRQWGRPVMMTLWLCLLWIAVSMCAHVPVMIDPVTFADVRYLLPALPAMCLLMALCCAGWPRLRWFLALGLCGTQCLGLVDSSREWQAAGKATLALRSAVDELIENHQSLELHGIPSTLGRAHFGIELQGAFNPPFRSVGEPRVEVYGDMYDPHLGIRRTSSFLALLASIRDSREGIGLAYFDRHLQALKSMPDPELRFELRGRTRSLPNGEHGLFCAELRVQYPDGRTVPPPGNEVRLVGRLDSSGQHPRFVVESIAENADPILTVRRTSTDAAKMDMRIVGPPGSFYTVFAALMGAVRPVPGFGLLLADATQPVLRGSLDDRGHLNATFDVGVRLRRVQIVLFTPTGEVLMSRCVCED